MDSKNISTGNIAAVVQTLAALRNMLSPKATLDDANALIDRAYMSVQDTLEDSGMIDFIGQMPAESDDNKYTFKVKDMEAFVTKVEDECMPSVSDDIYYDFYKNLGDGNYWGATVSIDNGNLSATLSFTEEGWDEKAVDQATADLVKSSLNSHFLAPLMDALGDTNFKLYNGQNMIYEGKLNKYLVDEKAKAPSNFDIVYPLWEEAMAFNFGGITYGDFSLEPIEEIEDLMGNDEEPIVLSLYATGECYGKDEFHVDTDDIDKGKLDEHGALHIEHKGKPYIITPLFDIAKAKSMVVMPFATQEAAAITYIKE